VLEAAVAAYVIPLVALALGVAVVIGIVGLGWVVRLEDRRYSLVSEASGRLSGRVRRLNGVGRRDLDPELFRAAVTSVR
jgi:hypothetical protein